MFEMAFKSTQYTSKYNYQIMIMSLPRTWQVRCENLVQSSEAQLPVRPSVTTSITQSAAASQSTLKMLWIIQCRKPW